MHISFNYLKINFGNQFTIKVVIYIVALLGVSGWYASTERMALTPERGIIKPKEIKSNNLAKNKHENKRMGTLKEMAEPKMATIPGGTFKMGEIIDETAYEQEKVHTIFVDGFRLGITEVTFEEYDLFCKTTMRLQPKDEWGRGKHPVINVSWEDAVAYCNWLSRQHKLQPVYQGEGTEIQCDRGANGYRLPTEAEWEYAARAGGQKINFGNGKDIANPNEINFNASEENQATPAKSGVFRGRTIEVGSLNCPNSLGLFDMSGNVWEWCWDWFDKNYYQTSPERNPQGASDGDIRVIRGGSWHDKPNYCLVSVRSGAYPFFQLNEIGFRLAQNLP